MDRSIKGSQDYLLIIVFSRVFGDLSRSSVDHQISRDIFSFVFPQSDALEIHELHIAGPYGLRDIHLRMRKTSCGP